MSGTSMDGIDAAIIKTDGINFIENLGHHSYIYDDAMRSRLKTALKDAEKIQVRDQRPGQLKDIENELTLLHVDAVKELLIKFNLTSKDIDFIGFHGQTILHKPELALTVQLGDGNDLARCTNINVVYDMRANDMLYGGQGAPLVPIYHQAIARKLGSKISLPVAFVNIGGISNLTWIDQGDNLVAFDCGPGNALLDQWMKFKTDKNYDLDGMHSAKGKVIQSIVETYQMHDFFQKKQSGSLDWRDFKPLINDDVSVEDGAATLCYLTAYGIIHSLRHVPILPHNLIISGGGAHNKTIMQHLIELAAVKNIKIYTATTFGIASDFLEAEAWGYLAVRAAKNLPLTFPKTTGCFKPVSGGVIVFAPK